MTAAAPDGEGDEGSNREVTIRAKNIPDELKERDQWLLWDASANTPRRPHWRGDFGVSWSDPDDWRSFEDAYAAAQERETWGIGYVFAADHDDYEAGRYGALDLDGCATPDGEKTAPKDWLPSLKPFLDRDAYIEWSPSRREYGADAGLHIPLRDFEPPDWWSDTAFPDRDHEGVEAHGSKFFTVTGDKIDLAGNEVPETGDWVEDWLVEAHKAITGDDPTQQQATDFEDASDGGRANRDEFLDESDIRDALDHIDPDLGYPTWRDIGFALQNFFESRTTALRVFKDWSRGGTKWDDDAPDLAERIIEDATSGGGRTIGTVIHYAQKGDDGWEMPTPTTTSPEPATTDPDRLGLEPSSVRALAGVGEDGGISDLTDREKAAVVWELIRHNDGVHVRVRRDNDSLWAYDDGVWTREGERALRHAARQALGSMHYGSNVLAELKAQARADPGVEVEGDEMGLNPGQIAVENGLIDLDAAAADAADDAIRDLQPEDYALTRLPVEYDPSADYDEWAGYVDEWAEDGRADALQEYVGYCLHVGALPIHRALLLVGEGANGKGTFLHVVRALLGEENTTSIELQTLANEKDAVADFYGSLANIDDDLSARKLGQGLGMFKKLVAGDRVRARHLYEDGFEYTATGKHLYAANKVPDVNVPDDDEAFWRRWLLVEFPNFYPPSERDGDLRDKLTEPDALAGVLNWAIEGRRRLLEQGYFTGEDHYAQQKRERWQSWGDSVDKFISECVERDPDAPKITSGDAHRRYAAWCRENDEDPVGQQQFTNTVKEEDVEYSGSIQIGEKMTRGYHALGFTDDVPALEDTPERQDPGDAQQESLFD